ncbi:MAG: hypothetical protein M1813_006304 [Trichoglossum hirsutum]|nr:MAG: hypothetical protein M1813_006304 [Trichoglossum hirsutum]
MNSAIVAGATGILGREIVLALSGDSQKWQTVHALSRKQKEEYPPNVKHERIDLTANKRDLATQLKDVEGEYLFFAAYLQRDTEQENWDANGAILGTLTDAGAMLKNFLDALAITGAEKKLKRVILATGAKQYGVHLGPPKNPMEETDPWVEGPDRPPNFYYNQQNILKEAAKGKDWDWVVTYPNDVIGYARGNFMNLTTALGLYATVCHELGEPLLFPGSERFYTGFDCFTSSKLHAQFNLWAALEPKCGNQVFNVVNGDTDSWQALWPKVSARFGCHIPASQFSLPAPFASRVDLHPRPPAADMAAQTGLEGRIKPGVLEQRVDLTKWSREREVSEAWDRVMKREGLDGEAWEKATWAFLGFVLGRNYDCIISMSKARRFGWTGYADTWDAFSDAFDELEKQKVIPKTKN